MWRYSFIAPAVSNIPCTPVVADPAPFALDRLPLAALAWDDGRAKVCQRAVGEAVDAKLGDRNSASRVDVVVYQCRGQRVGTLCGVELVDAERDNETIRVRRGCDAQIWKSGVANQAFFKPGILGAHQCIDRLTGGPSDTRG